MQKDMKKILADILKKQNQAQLAEQIGVTQGYISHLMLGRRKKPSFEIGSKIIEIHKELQKQDVTRESDHNK